jgi:hypothetical protein
MGDLGELWFRFIMSPGCRLIFIFGAFGFFSIKGVGRFTSSLFYKKFLGRA